MMEEKTYFVYFSRKRRYGYSFHALLHPCLFANCGRFLRLFTPSSTGADCAEVCVGLDLTKAALVNSLKYVPDLQRLAFVFHIPPESFIACKPRDSEVLSLCMEQKQSLVQQVIYDQWSKRDTWLQIINERLRSKIIQRGSDSVLCVYHDTLLYRVFNRFILK